MTDYKGTSGDDDITGTSGDDNFDMTQGGNDIVHAGDGNDGISFGMAFTSQDQVDGGTGNDVLFIGGAGFATPLVMQANTMQNVEGFFLGVGGVYNIAMNDANVGAGQTLTQGWWSFASESGTVLNFDGSAETDGSFNLLGWDGNDTIKGGANGDLIDLSHGGDDTAYGEGGGDLFILGAAFTAADRIDGGSGSDTVTLDGDYSARVSFGASTMRNVEQITLDGGHSYNLKIADVTVASGATLTVDGSSLGSSDTFTFDGSAETDGMLSLKGGAGNDNLTGGAGNDSFDVSNGGDDTIKAGGGDDGIGLGMNFTAADRIDGGTGYDVIFAGGANQSMTIAFTATTMQNVETLYIGIGGSYHFTMNDANVAAGQTFSLSWWSAGGEPSTTLVFDGSAEKDGSFYLLGWDGNDTLTGGAKDDYFDLSKGGDDIANGGGGDDTFYLGGAFTSADQIDGGSGYNTIVLDGDYSNSGPGSFGPIMFIPGTFKNINEVDCGDNGSYVIILDSSDVVHKTFTFNAHGLSADHWVNIDATATQAGGHLVFIGGAGDDILRGGNDSDSFDLTFGGDDLAVGNQKNDVFNLGDALTADDKIDGGKGTDTVNLDGDYSSGLVFSDTTFRNIEVLNLAGGHSYDLTTAYFTLNGSQTMTVGAFALGESDSLAFDGHIGPNGSFVILAGAGDDDLTGGALNDSFDLSKGGDDVASGLSGNDTFVMGAALTSADSIDGGLGNDTVALKGDYSDGLILSDTTLLNVEKISLAKGFSYDLTTDDATVANGATLTVDASKLGAHNFLAFDGSAETDGSFVVAGGAGNDVLEGGARGDILTGGQGKDILTGGSGADQFVYAKTSDSAVSANHRDIIFDFSHAEGDRIDLSNIDADTTQNGDQAFHLGGSAFSHHAGELIQFVDARGHTIVEGDVNGDAVADFALQLNGAPVLVSADFVL